MDSNGLARIEIYYNNFYIDKFFIKTMMFYDLKMKQSTLAKKILRHDEKRIYNIALGASFRFVITNLQDEKIVEVGG